MYVICHCEECDNGGWCGGCRIDYPGKDAKSVLEALPPAEPEIPDDARDAFMNLVYDELHSDGDNNRANRIIDAADEYVEYSLAKQSAQLGTNLAEVSTACISRQAALDIFDDYNVAVENGQIEAYSRDRKRLCDLPPAQPHTYRGVTLNDVMMYFDSLENNEDAWTEFCSCLECRGWGLYHIRSATDKNVETNEDCISRQAAILQLSHNKNKGDEEWELAVENDIQTIWKLPPAQPEQRTGEYVHVSGYDDQYKCTACGIDIVPMRVVKFCPECGAKILKMISGERVRYPWEGAKV